LSKTINGVLALLICLSFLLSASNIVVSEGEPDLLTKILRVGLLNQEFDQYIDIDYDSAYINESLQIDQSLNVPIQITYWTSVPSTLWTKGVWGIGILSKISSLGAFMISNKVVYGMGMPQQSIELRIIDKPEWLECNFTKSKFPIDFQDFDDRSYTRDPFFFPDRQSDEESAFVKDFPDTNKSLIQTSLILSPLSDAPAQQYSILIEVYLSEQGMIKEAVYQRAITFSPSFFPKIDFNVMRPIQLRSPQNSVNFPISVTNTANKKIKVIPNLGLNDSQGEEINPKFCVLLPNESSLFYLSKFSDDTFGWHDTIDQYAIDFYVQLAPFESNISYGPYPVKVQLNTYGLSTPAFSILLFLLSVILISTYRKKL